MSSKVYYADLHTTLQESLPKKLHRLMKAAGFEEIDFEDRFAAIKIHFGEPGNLAYLRPNYAKVIVDYVKELGGKAFLTDCNTLYVGSRKNALEHLDAAYTNGFSPFSTGCHVIIADGIKGTDETYVPVVGGEYVKEAKIGTAVMDADVVISLSHFKAHESAGFGGCIKNIGMGCGSRAGKMEMHSNGKPLVKDRKCVGCGSCIKICAHDAITIDNKIAYIDHEYCAGCGRCIGVCPKDAIVPQFNEAYDILNYKMAEYTKAVLDGRPAFHINMVIDVSPACDCHSHNDMPIVPDIGMFASFDPVALDHACLDAVNAAPPMPGSKLDGTDPDDHDHFHAIATHTDGIAMLKHGEKIGLGQLDYELIKI